MSYLHAGFPQFIDVFVAGCQFSVACNNSLKEIKIKNMYVKLNNTLYLDNFGILPTLFWLRFKINKINAIQIIAF